MMQNDVIAVAPNSRCGITLTQQRFCDFAVLIFVCVCVSAAVPCSLSRVGSIDSVLLG